MPDDSAYGLVDGAGGLLSVPRVAVQTLAHRDNRVIYGNKELFMVTKSYLW